MYLYYICNGKQDKNITQILPFFRSVILGKLKIYTKITKTLTKKKKLI